MDLIKRTLTAVVLLGSLFVIIQFAPDWAFFVFGLGFVVAAVLEFYSLTGKKGLGPQKVLGSGLAVLVLLPYYFRTIPLEAALFAAVLAAGVYFVVATNTPEKLALARTNFGFIGLRVAASLSAQYGGGRLAPAHVPPVSGAAIHGAEGLSLVQVKPLSVE